MTGAETDRNPTLEWLLNKANVNYAQRDEFRQHPAQAIDALLVALNRPRIERKAAYALTRYRAAVQELEARILEGDQEAEHVVVSPELVARARSAWSLPAVALAALEEAASRGVTT